MKQQIKEFIYKLSELNSRVLYIPQLESYYKVNSFTPADPSSHIHYNELDGVDITTYVLNIESNFDFISLINKIENLPDNKMKFSSDFQWIWFL